MKRSNRCKGTWTSTVSSAKTSLWKPVLAMLVAVTLLAACSSSGSKAATTHKAAAALQDVTVGAFMPAFDGIQAPLAQAEGFFKRNGLNVNLVNFTTGPTMAAALVGGTDQIGWQTSADAFPANTKGANMVFLTGSEYMNYNLIAGPHVSLAAPNGSFDQRIHELVGKTVGVSAIGAGTYFMVLRWLKRAGIATSAVSIIGVGGTAAQIAALKEGRIDFLVDTPPVEQLLGAGNYQMVINVLKHPDWSPVPTFTQAGNYATTRPYLNAHKQVVNDFCRAMWQTQAWMQNSANVGKVEAYLQKALTLTPAQAKGVWAEYGSGMALALSPKNWQGEGDLNNPPATPSYTSNVYGPCTHAPG